MSDYFPVWIFILLISSILSYILSYIDTSSQTQSKTNDTPIQKIDKNEQCFRLLNFNNRKYCLMVSKYNENVIAMVCEIIAEIDGKKCLLPMRGYSVHFENAELIPVTAKICREHKFHIEEIRDKSFILVKNK